MMYRDYIRTLSRRFASEFSEIQGIYNFDYGSEFELALCYLLRQILPKHYGVCRGHVVTRDGETAGDDIIVYDSFHFPTLTLRRADEFGRKEHIPIEAVLAYVEAKHTIVVEGNSDESGTLAQAVSQTGRVKDLVLRRQPLEPRDKIRGIRLGPPFDSHNKPDFPTRCDPVFTAVVARFGRPSKAEGDKRSVLDALKQRGEDALAKAKEKPDMIVLGENDVFLSTAFGGPGEPNRLDSPFFVDKKSDLSYRQVDGTAFGLFLLRLLQAIDWIRLSDMPYAAIIGDAIGAKILKE